MGYRDTGGGPQYVPTTDISLGILRHLADEYLRDQDTGDDAREAWEHVVNVLAVVDQRALDMDSPFAIQVPGQDVNGPETFNRTAVARVNAFRRALQGDASDPVPDQVLIENAQGSKARVQVLEVEIKRLNAGWYEANGRALEDRKSVV